MVTEQDILNIGYKPTQHPQDLLLFENTAADFSRVFKEQIEGMTLFLYRLSEQEQGNRHEGHAQVYFDRLTGVRSYAIGISVEALETGAEYAAGVLCHELGHVLTDRQNQGIADHSDTFRRNTLECIKRYEQETGKDLSKWDFTGAAVQIRRE